MTTSRQLEAAVAAWLAGQGGGSRRAGSKGLTATYRKGGTSREVDFAAYLVARLPATFAAVQRVLGELRNRRPDIAPRSILDAGSGPGTASWAAAEAWPDLETVTFLDNAPAFLALAGELAAHGTAALARARRVAATIDALPEGLSADIVVAAYALAELPASRMAEAASQLWRTSRAAMAVIEPGTPEGSRRVRAVREHLLAIGAVPVAPCTHAAACPVSGSDWCHFSVRLARSRAHMHAKSATVPFEDEKFAYVILARDGTAPGGGRVIAPPVHGKPGSTFRLCTQTGIETRHIARRDAAAYKRVRKLEWGGWFGPEGEDSP